MYAVIAAVVSAALLVYFTVRIAREPKSSDCVVYIPRWLFFLGLAVYVFGAGVGVAMLAIGRFFLAIPCLLCMLFGCAAMLCCLNQKVVSVGDGEYVYSTMFGREKRFNASDYVRMTRNSDSLTLKFKNGKMHIDNLAIIGDDFKNSLIEGKKD